LLLSSANDNPLAYTVRIFPPEEFKLPRSSTTVEVPPALPATHIYLHLRSEFSISFEAMLPKTTVPSVSVISTAGASGEDV